MIRCPVVEDGRETELASAGRTVEIVADVTPFYGEAGGQAGDTGKITGDDLDMEILDTVKDPTGLIIHKGKIISGHIEKGETVTLTVNKSKRDATACNHTATHILHFALRKILGDHVKQAGSLVAPDRLRFDFTHFSQTDSETLDKIETLVNQKIRQNFPVRMIEMKKNTVTVSGSFP